MDDQTFNVFSIASSYGILTIEIENKSHDIDTSLAALEEAARTSFFCQFCGSIRRN